MMYTKGSPFFQKWYIEGVGPRAEPSRIKLLHKVICKNKNARFKRLGHTLVNFSAKYSVNK